MRPGVGGVVRDIHGDIADHLNALRVGVAHDVLPGKLKAVLKVGLNVRLLGKSAVGEERGLPSLELSGPLVARHAAGELLDGHKGAVGFEPGALLGYVVAVGDIGARTAGGLPAHIVGAELGLGLGQKVDVARKGRGAGVGGVKEVGGINRQHLPVAEAHGGEVVDKALGGRTQGARTAILGGERRDVADHARTRLERLLESLVGVERDHGGAKGP